MLPDHVSILGIRFDVTTTPKIEKDPDLLGLCKPMDRKIWIKKEKDATPYVLEERLLHEIIHGILGVTGHSERMTDDEEEALVIALESGIHLLYKRR